MRKHIKTVNKAMLNKNSAYLVAAASARLPANPL